jgi:hypothetical protein
MSQVITVRRNQVETVFVPRFLPVPPPTQCPGANHWATCPDATFATLPQNRGGATTLLVLNLSGRLNAKGLQITVAAFKNFLSRISLSNKFIILSKQSLLKDRSEVARHYHSFFITPE